MLLAIVLTQSLLAATPSLSDAPLRARAASFAAEKYVPGSQVPDHMTLEYRDGIAPIVGGVLLFGLGYLPSAFVGMYGAMFLALGAASGFDLGDQPHAVLIIPIVGPFLLAGQNRPEVLFSPMVQLINGGAQIAGAALVTWGFMTRGTYLVPQRMAVAPIGPNGSSGLTFSFAI